MTATLLNAYSAYNAGDGLLVKLALETIREASAGRGISQPATTIVAADPASFAADIAKTTSARTIGAPASLASSRLTKVAEAAIAVLGRAPRRIAQCIEQSDAAVCVGGGYLRFGNTEEAFKASAVHLSQIAAAVERCPTVLLPQSIGPLRQPYSRRVLRVLSSATAVYVRDDRSADELSALDNVVRMPDMAVLEIARAGEHSRIEIAEHAKPMLVARELRNPGTYYESLKKLLTLSPSMTIGLQSTAGGRNDDSHLASTLNADGATVSSLSRMASSGLVCVTVSVRLHGALQSILAGVPAIHLSYERKGFAAYSDLGISDYVHNARNFSAELVAQQVSELSNDPDRYFSRLATSIPANLNHRDALVRSLARVL